MSRRKRYMRFGWRSS
ncbi:hypothetical protein EDM52_08550 [Brevibacillus invocatus]|uniref:Uncharacterized protein n=1 Tax=Brevibacillus invocatus TaxID=173959 RepID=A0A3M8CH42_9BACL|nr:hypothetical protein EDM52_08550 [Brevibacillus invocatus]